MQPQYNLLIFYVKAPEIRANMPGISIKNSNGLEVNDGPLLPENIAYLTPSSPCEPLETLRTRYEQDGMLLLKGLLPRQDVLRTRTKYFEMMSPSVVLEQNTQPIEGIFNSTRSPDDFPGIGAGAAGQNGRPGGESAQAFVDLAIEAHYQDWYSKDLAKHPALLDFVARFTGWNENILGLNRSLLRNNVPGTKPIGVHYDQIFLRYGEPTSVTAWVPIGDVSLSGGGLIYLEDGAYTPSHPFCTLVTNGGNRRRSRSSNRTRIHQKSPRSRHDRGRSQKCIQSKHDVDGFIVRISP